MAKLIIQDIRLRPMETRVFLLNYIIWEMVLVETNIGSKTEEKKTLFHRWTRPRYVTIYQKQNCENNVQHNQTSQDRSNY